MKVHLDGTEDEAFQKAAADAADHLMTAALPRALPTRSADAAVRMAASLGLVTNNAKMRMMDPDVPPSQADVEQFMRSYGGAMGTVCETLPDAENSAVLAVHYMLDYMGRKDPTFRGRVMAKLALLYLDRLDDPPPGPMQ